MDFQKIIYICLLLIGTQSLQAQLTLTGKVLDADAQSPLQYAQVRLCGKSLATLTNEYGEFRFHIPAPTPTDSLCISFIGYQTYSIALADWNPENTPTIALTSSNATVEEVVIQGKKRKIPSWKIVQMALEKLPENYPQNTFLLKGYYRDYLKRNEEYLNLQEVALSVYDQGIYTYDFSKTRIKAHQIRFNTDYQVDLGWRKSYADQQKKIPGAQMLTDSQNEFTILRVHDPIRNHDQQSFSFIDVLSEHFIPNHKFEKKKLTVLDGIPVYVIPFSYKNQSGATYFHDAKGEISIRADNFAISQLRYTNYFTYRDIPPEGKRYEVVVAYQEYEGNMYLKYISVGNYFVMESAQPLFYVDTTYTLPTQDILRVQFNAPPDERSATRAQNYVVSFRNQPIPVAQARLTGDKEVSLKIPGLQRLLARPSDELFFSAPKVKDKAGNRINVKQTEGLYQYREFFTNEIVSQGVSISFMEQSDKSRPFYQQSIPENPDFWKTYNYVLNQPLQE